MQTLWFLLCKFQSKCYFHFLPCFFQAQFSALMVFYGLEWAGTCNPTVPHNSGPQFRKSIIFQIDILQRIIFKTLTDSLQVKSVTPKQVFDLKKKKKKLTIMQGLSLQPIPYTFLHLKLPVGHREKKSKTVNQQMSGRQKVLLVRGNAQSLNNDHHSRPLL